MRVLVTVNDAYGHVLPLAPAVLELTRRGHEVALAGPGDIAAKVLPQIRSLQYPGEAPPLAGEPPPREQRADRLKWAVEQSWPNAARAWASRLLADAREWRPDLVVSEPVEHAGRVVAAALDVPFVEHGWGFSLPAGTDTAAVAGLADLYAELGATPRDPVVRIDLGPSQVQAFDVDSGVQRFRYEPWAPPADPLPPPGRTPRVLVTLGTFPHGDAAERLRVAAYAVAESNLDLVVVLGNADRGDGADLPSGARVARWLHVPSEVDRCRLVVHHGGAGTSWATLAAGVPAVCLPQAGDQFRNAEILEWWGAAFVVPPENLDAVRETVTAALVDDGIPAGAEAARNLNSLMPPTTALVDLLESFVA